MSEIKTIANCKPTEFLKQTNKIKKAVESWLTATDIMAIFKRKAPVEIIRENATDEEKAEITARNVEAGRKQMAQNISDILDAVMEEHPEETIRVLALCCFIEPERADDYKVSYYLKAFTSLIADKDVLDFFTSLAQLGQMNISDVSKA